MHSEVRKAAVKGIFYPKECEVLLKFLKDLNHQFDTSNNHNINSSIIPRAAIVPHAGYIYSGFTANFAYRFLKQSNVKRIIAIGPSHHHYFQGISGSYYETYETPCGPLKVDSAYLFALAKKFNIGFEPKAHEKEHSTEVQFPFIQHYFPKKEVIELIYGKIDAKTLANIINALLQNKDNAVVISSDLSHFHDIKEANRLDENCLRSVERLDVTMLEKGCKACGLTGIKAMLLAAKHLKLSSKLLDYRTSAETSGDTTSVVGYMSAVFY